MARNRAIVLTIWIGLLASAAGGQISDPFGGPGGFGDGDKPGQVTMSLVPSRTQVRPGGELYVAVELQVAADWVLYSPDPGSDTGFEPIAAEIDGASQTLRTAPTRWPMDVPHPTDLGDRTAMFNAYDGAVTAFVPVSVPSDAEPGRHSIAVTLSGQVCSDVTGVCVPVRVERVAEVEVDSQPVANPAWSESLGESLAEAVTAGRLKEIHAGDAPKVPAPAVDYTIWTGLALALLAGLILNVMPCVLPVIPLRVLSVVEMARESRRRFVTLGLAFAGGIMLFFVALAILNAALLLITSEALDWGRHFQSVPLRIGLGLLVVAVAANLLGAFNVTLPGSVSGGETARSRGAHLRSGGMGLMMAILATPCSFGILILVLAWAQVQPLWLGTSAFLLLGVGMAAPHVLLTAFPGLVGKLPRPGRWMELLKQGMGLALLPVAIWLFATLAEEAYPFWVIAYGVVLAFCLWMWGSWVRYDAPTTKKLAVRGVAVVLAVAAGWWMLRPPAPLAVAGEPYTPAALSEARSQGRAVMVKFTATWCLSCKWVDATIYDSERVADLVDQRDVLVLRADVTREGTPASTLLYERLGGAPPLTVVYPPGDGQPIRLVGKFSVEELLTALDRAAGGA